RTLGGTFATRGSEELVERLPERLERIVPRRELVAVEAHHRDVLEGRVRLHGVFQRSEKRGDAAPEGAVEEDDRAVPAGGSADPLEERDPLAFAHARLDDPGRGSSRLRPLVTRVPHDADCPTGGAGSPGTGGSSRDAPSGIRTRAAALKG